ncbi:MAG TPA: hypothetical protein VJ476_06700 [Rhizomicrobium sp.]|nr:hypothetical protein [Rhizomicrobium sp.]
MGLGLKRSDLQAVAQCKLDDAATLLQHNRYSNAYYLAGYAVEIGLKACIARQMTAETIPDKALIKKILNHDFSTLIGLAGLAQPLKDHQDGDATFATYWGIVGEWEPDIRYEPVEQMSAQLLVQAVGDPKSGVLTWIKTHW